MSPRTDDSLYTDYFVLHTNKELYPAVFLIPEAGSKVSTASFFCLNVDGGRLNGERELARRSCTHVLLAYSPFTRLLSTSLPHHLIQHNPSSNRNIKRINRPFLWNDKMVIRLSQNWITNALPF